MLMFYLTKFKWCNEHLRFSCGLLYMLFATLKIIQIPVGQHLCKCWLFLWGIMTTSILFCMFWIFFFSFLFEITCNIHLSSNFFFFIFVSMFCDYLQFWLHVLRLFALMEGSLIGMKRDIEEEASIITTLYGLVISFCDWNFNCNGQGTNLSSLTLDQSFMPKMWLSLIWLNA